MRDDRSLDCVTNDTLASRALWQSVSKRAAPGTDRGVLPVTSPEGAAEALPFAVDATAVRLAIHPHLLGEPNPFRPAFAKIAVEEGNPLLFGHALADRPDEIVFLKAAVKEGRCKRVESALLRDPRRPAEPQKITVRAPLLFAEGDLPEILIQRIRLLPDNRELRLSSECIERLKALPVFKIGMDVWVVKKTRDIIPLLFQYPKGINRARSATDMQQDSHG
jgi:hypothetical protein